MEKIRSFIAIEIPQPLKQRLGTIIEELKAKIGTKGLSWVSAHSLHITVKFLGNIEVSKLSALGDALMEAGSATKPFSITIEGLGAFPSLAAPRVLWAGITRSAELEQLHRRVEGLLAPLGFEPDDRPFKPHLTLCRVKNPAGRLSVAKGLSGFKDKLVCESFIADAIILFKSELRRGGAVHTPLRVVPFSH